MLLVELVMQGVGPFPGTTRIDLSEGFNLITGGNESGKTTIYNCLFSFLNINHTDSRRLVNLDATDTSRASLIFKSRGGEKYKVVQDYLKGEVAAFKFNPSSEMFDSLDNGEAWLKEFLRSESGGLGPEDMKEVFGLQCNALLSIVFQVNKGSKAVSAVSAGDDREEIHFKENRLMELRGALKKAEELSRAEDRMDEVQNKIHDFGKKLEDINAIEERLKEVSEGLGELKSFADLPADMPQLIAAYEKREEEKGDGYRRFEEELFMQEEDLAGIQSRPLYRNKTFLIGGTLAILSNVIIFSISLPAMVRPLYWVAFLGGLGMLGYAIFKEIQVNTMRSEKEEKVKTLRSEMRKFVRRYEKENAPFLEIVKKTSSKDPADMKKRYRRYRELSEMKGALEREMGHILEGRDKKSIEEECQSLQALRKELQEKAAGDAGMCAKSYEIKEEIERLEAELRPRWAKAMEIEAGRAVAESPFPDIKRMLEKDFREFMPRIRDEARRHMEKLSSGAYRLDMGEDACICLYRKDGKEKIMPSLLSPGAITQIYLSIRFAILSVF